MTTIDLSPFANEQYCYLTTRGRNTGKPHEIEIWFCVHEGALYLLSGGMDSSDDLVLYAKSFIDIIADGQSNEEFLLLFENASLKSETKTFCYLM